MAIEFTSIPRRGDAVIGNKATGKVLYVKQDSLVQQSDIDTSVYEIIGVVLKRRSKKALVAYKENASRQWSQRYSYRLTGYTLDGATHTGVLSIREASNSWGSNVDYTISYSASSVAEMADALNTYFRANAPFTTQDWVAEVDGNGDITLHFNYATWQQSSYNTGSGGFVLTANLLPEVTAHADMRRVHGGNGGEGAISSWYKALQYYRNDNGSSSYMGGRTSDQGNTIKQTYPINLPTWLGTSVQNPGDFCAGLRAIYGEGEAGWLKFMRTCMPVNPTDFGDMGKTNGLELTKIMASKLFTSQALTNQPMFPAASYCYGIGTVCVPQGNWFLGTTRDVADMLSDIKYGSEGSSRSLDPVNATLEKIGGTAISNGSYWWSCLRYHAGGAWSASGVIGFFNVNYMYGAYGCVPVALLKLA